MRNPGHRPDMRSLEEYLAFEMASDEKHEYVEGCVYAMSGATDVHVRIAGNIHGHVWAAARNGACRVFASDFKLRTPSDRVYYPDVMTVCTARDSDGIFVTDPCLIVEVTSSSSVRTDRYEKRDAYLAMPSLHAYLVVDQRRRHIDWHHRAANGTWKVTTLAEQGAIDVPCPALRLTVDEVYEGITLSPTSVRRIREPEPTFD